MVGLLLLVLCCGVEAAEVVAAPLEAPVTHQQQQQRVHRAECAALPHATSMGCHKGAAHSLIKLGGFFKKHERNRHSLAWP